MKSYGEEVIRRIEQFNKILVAMQRRAQKEIQGPCFVIFGVDDPCGRERPAKSAEAVMADELILAGFADAGVASIPCERSESDFSLPTEGWGESDAMSRYV